MKKILGIDIGITSIGWGIIDLEDNIIDAGVRLFDEADVKNNADRRNFRGTRRLIRRRRQRIVDMKELLIKHGFIKPNFVSSKDPYELRLKGLSNQLENEELATVLLHYAKKRGSSLETVGEGKDEQSTKTILSENEKLLEKDQYIVHIQLNRLKETGKIRGHNNVFKTKDYLKEAEKILSNQNLEQSLKENIIDIIKRRRHYSHGPGNKLSPSPYGRYRSLKGNELNQVIHHLNTNFSKEYKKKTFTFTFDNKEYRALKGGQVVNKDPFNLIELMRGKCSIFPDKLRAPKNAFSAELFNLLNDLNNLIITNRENNKITKEEKDTAIKHIREKGNLTVVQLLKVLNAELIDVTGFRVDKNKNPILTEFKGYKKLLKVYKDLKIKITDDKTLDKITETLTKTDLFDERYQEILSIVDNKELAESLSNLTGISQYHSLSLDAIYLLNDELINTTLNQQQIITEKNLKSENHLRDLKLDEEAILSPVAKRAHRETFKLIKELINLHGDFERIIIETTREKNSADARKIENERQRYFEQSKKEAAEIIGDYSPENITPANILKIRLLKEQDSKCAYTGLPIDIGRLLRDPRSYEIDHIIPLSISLDNSLNNRVLVVPSANQKKKNKTPFGYFSTGDLVSGTKINNWDMFEEYVLNNKNYSTQKKRNLLFTKNINKFEVRQEFINRNLVDTSYAIRTVMNTLKQYFKANDIDTKVLTIKGKQTNMFRGIGSNILRQKTNLKNEDNIFIKDRNKYIHHAVDALIIAGLSNQKNIRSLYDLAKDYDTEYVYDKDTGEVISPAESSNIHKYLMNLYAYTKDNNIKYTWKVDTKPNRSISDQTIYSTRIYDNEHYVIKKYNDIYDLDGKKLEKILGKDKESLLVYKHDIKTYKIIKDAYEQYKHEKYPLKTFRDNHGPIRKYSKKNNGPEINSLKYQENRLRLHLDITPDDANNKKVVKLQISPYRTDIYYSKKEKLYKFLTIRYKDLIKVDKGFKIDPNNYEDLKQLKKITPDYEFMFSLTRNNILSITKEEKDGAETETFRFIATNDDLANTLEVKPIINYDPKRIRHVIGRKISNISKFNISISGITSKVTKEDLKMTI